MWQTKSFVMFATLAIVFAVKGRGEDDWGDSHVKGTEPCQLRMVLQVTGHWGGAVFVENGTIPFNIIVVNDTNLRASKKHT